MSADDAEQAIDQVARETLRDYAVIFVVGIAAGVVLARIADITAAVLRAIAAA